MGTQGGLLERLRAAAGDRTPGGAEEAIRRNLSRLLNARRGSAPAALAYGLPDLNDLSSESGEILRSMRRALRETIERYEPRLADVAINFDRDEDDPLNLRFSVSAQIDEDGERRAVRYETLVNSSGRFEVRG